MRAVDRIRRRWAAVLVLALGLTLLPAGPAALAQGASSGVVAEFAVPGYYGWAPPVWNWYVIEIFGAQGGNCPHGSPTRQGGKGGYTRILMYLTSDDSVSMAVGGQGAPNSPTSGVYNPGGFNRGGRGSYRGSGGGGSSAFSSSNANGIGQATAGGGGGCNTGSWPGDGGAGGGESGQAGQSASNAGGGGTSSSAGAGGGGAPAGGDFWDCWNGGGSNSTSASIAGGGAGYCGGGAGYGAGGGGAGTLPYPQRITSVFQQAGVREGNGLVRISWGHPQSATPVSPADDAVWNTSSLQEFTATVSSYPVNDVRVQVRVEDIDTGVVRLLESEAGAGDSSRTVRAVPLLPAGRYRWQSAACAGSATMRGCSAYSAPRSLTVLGNRAAQIGSVNAPADGRVFSTNDGQTFSVTAQDPDGDSYVAKFEVVASSAAFDSAGEVEFLSGLTAHNSPAVASPPSKFGVGSYKWRATVTDTGSGRASEPSATRTFTVAAAPPPAVNQPPSVPTLNSPADGHQFLFREPHRFVGTSTDPEGDAYRLYVLAVHETGIEFGFEGVSAASGQPATTERGSPLPSGSYSWKARAVPASGGGFGSDWSATRTFTVAPATTNRPPNTPTLIAPAEGHAFSGDQTFTVKAKDDDGDIYHGRIEIEQYDGANLIGYWVTDTAPAMSDSESSVTMTPALPQGSGYRWRAQAIDPSGSRTASPPSAWRTFTIN